MVVERSDESREVKWARAEADVDIICWAGMVIVYLVFVSSEKRVIVIANCFD